MHIDFRGVGVAARRFAHRLFRVQPKWVKVEVRNRVNGDLFAVDFYSDGSQRLRELSSECKAQIRSTFGAINPALFAQDDLLRSEARSMQQEFDSILVQIKDGKVSVL
jgi:hypothetical protein